MKKIIVYVLSAIFLTAFNFNSVHADGVNKRKKKLVKKTASVSKVVRKKKFIKVSFSPIVPKEYPPGIIKPGTHIKLDFNNLSTLSTILLGITCSNGSVIVSLLINDPDISISEFQHVFSKPDLLGVSLVDKPKNPEDAARIISKALIDEFAISSVIVHFGHISFELKASLNLNRIKPVLQSVFSDFTVLETGNIQCRVPQIAQK